MSNSTPKAPAWQQESALILHRAFREMQSDIADGATLKIAAKSKSIQLRCTLVGPEQKKLKCSAITLLNRFRAWRAAGSTYESLLPKYGGSKSNAIPDALIHEYQRLATRPTGGRDKHGRSPLSVPYRELCKAWKAGSHVPGLGTWRDWWETNPTTRKHKLPPVAPEFPFTERAFRRHQPARAVMAGGNIGGSAKKGHEANIERDYSQLRKGELYTLDDVRLDFTAINELTGRSETVSAYIFQEVASRAIVGFIVKPKSAVNQMDVDELLARCLQTEGFGIGVGYVTFILFERGTLACSPAAQLNLESGTNNGIKVVRTGMTEFVRWVGSSADRAKGNSGSKGTIESFNRRLHYELLDLPGQRGHAWAYAPENLGFGKDHDSYRPLLDETKEAQRTKLSSTAADERIAQFNIRMAHEGIFPGIRPNQLYFGDVALAVRKAIHHLNNDRGHKFKDHGKVQQIELKPGVWQDRETILNY